LFKFCNKNKRAEQSRSQKGKRKFLSPHTDPHIRERSVLECKGVPFCRRGESGQKFKHGKSDFDQKEKNKMR
jgi:hypothetical protein